MIKIFLTIIFILSANLVQAQCQSAISTGMEWIRCDYFENVGGLNNAFSPINVADNEASDIQNFILTTSGNIKTRDGFGRVNFVSLGASTATNGITYYRPTSGTQYLVAIFSDDTIQKMDFVTTGPDATWDDITGSLSFAVGADNFADFAVGQDILIIEDGLNTTAPYRWNGSGNATALGGSPPNCTMVAYHKRHAFCAGNNSNPSTLYFSNLDDIENWTGGLSGNLPIETNDGSVIRDIEPGFDALYIWKDNSIWRLSGEDKDTFELERMVQDIGTLSSQSVALIGNDFIFMDSKGDVYIYDGGVKLNLISAKIDGTIDAMNFNRIDNVVGLVYNNDYYLSFSRGGVSTHDRVLVFDTFHSAWTLFAGLNVNAMTVGLDGNAEDIIYWGDYAGFVNQYPSGTNDAGGAINAFYNTKQYKIPGININKTLEVTNILVDQQGNYNLTVETRRNFGSTGTAQTINLSSASSAYGTAVYGVDIYGGQNLIIGRLEWGLEGQFFQLRFSNANVAGSDVIEINGWQLFLSESDRI